jgi:gas vesicle protein
MSDTTDFLAGVFVGALLGGAAALLLAPSSGEETRGQLMSKAEELKDKAVRRGGELLDTGKEKLVEGKERVVAAVRKGVEEASAS